MPRAGSVYTLPSSYLAVSGETIEATQHNDPLEDIATDLNTARPIGNGGTGQVTAVAAIDALHTKGANVASATTTDIGASSGRFIHITGTTTITGLGTKTAGVVRILTFDGILILTHNATSLILPGAANITTAANDCAVMVSEGSGNWRCIAYQKAASLPITSADTATDTTAGIVEGATDAEVYAATANKFLDAALIESASAMVALTDASPVVVDWDAGINFSLTVSADRQIDNPTNGQPGTYRTILVQADSGTNRTITFDTQYLGVVPTITDCDNAKWYLLTIRCITTTHFVVSSQVAKS